MSAVLPPANIQSRMLQLMLAAQKLTEPENMIYSGLYLQGQPREVIARQAGLTPEQFDRRHENMLRTLKNSTQ